MNRRLLLLACFCVAGFPGSSTAQTIPPPSDGVSRVMREFERILIANDNAGYTALVAPDADSQGAYVVDEWFQPGITRAIVQERLRVDSKDVPAGDGVDVYVDVLTEAGDVGRVGTWRLELRRDRSIADGWRVQKLKILTTVSGLYRLSLNPEKEFSINNLTLTAEDFRLTLPQGVAFVAEAEAGITGIVLLGRGTATFAPAPAAEKGQVKIYSGSETMETHFSWLYVRVHPADFDKHIAAEALKPRTVDPRDLRRAELVFQENLELSFGLDLGDMSRDKWSVLPQPGNLVAEFQTDKSHLTYMRSASDPEDIRLFDRTRQRTISIYASKEKLASQGPFFNEDNKADYDILDYDIDASFDPRREWIEGKATLLLTARHGPVNSLVLALAEPLALRSVASREMGYLMALRVSGQKEIIINLPEALEPDEVLDLEMTYGGRLPAVPPDREALEFALPQQVAGFGDFFTMKPLPSYTYTGRSYWYPQGQVTDYATATLTLRVPENYETVASGALDEGFPKLVPGESRGPVWKEYHFSATQPVRYLGWSTSQFVHVDSAEISLPPREGASIPPFTGVSYQASGLSIESSGMLQSRARELSVDARRVLAFYGTLLGDIPYQTFTVAMVEQNTPGGHSPPYYAALGQPPPTIPIVWRSDPAYFDDFPEFFLAHEAAHQWWGQAVGWKNYHEQWISEGFAQYFAALYAEQLERKDVFQQIIRQMSRWTRDRSDQGPVYLGYRIGHIRNDSRTFRALVYNKGALSLHMLRRLMGDEAFFRGLRRFYATWRFRKAGTEDLRMAFELEANRPLDRFFQRWIYGSTLPRLRFSYRTEPGAVVVRFEQVGELFDVPITVTVEQDTSSVDVVVPVTEQVVERRIPVTGAVRRVEANRDDDAPVTFVK